MKNTVGIKRSPIDNLPIFINAFLLLQIWILCIYINKKQNKQNPVHIDSVMRSEHYTMQVRIQPLYSCSVLCVALINQGVTTKTTTFVEW